MALNQEPLPKTNRLQDEGIGSSEIQTYFQVLRLIPVALDVGM